MMANKYVRKQVEKKNIQGDVEANVVSGLSSCGPTQRLGAATGKENIQIKEVGTWWQHK